MTKQLIVYTDASFKDNRGGWAYVTKNDIKGHKPTVSYGCCDAKDSVQAEAIACIRAIDNIDLYDNLDSIIIRTDVQSIVKLTDRILYTRKKLKSISQEAYKFEEIWRIAIIQKQLGTRLRFEKVDSKNRYNRLADSYARKALNLEIDYDKYLYTEDAKTEPLLLKCKKNSEIYCAAFQPQIIPDIKGCEIVQVKVSEIDLVDTVHLEASALSLYGGLARAKDGLIFDQPIVIRPLDNGRYGLISGFRRYCIAKIMDIESIPGVVKLST